MLPKFLTADYPLEKHLFLVPGFALKLVGLYPETPRTLIVRLWSYLNFLILTTGCCAQYAYGFSYLDADVATALDALCPAFSSIMSWLKLCCIWYYRVEIKTLIERVRELNEAQNSNEKNEIKKRYFLISTRLSTMVACLVFSTSSSYSIRPFVMNIFQYFNEKPIVHQVPYTMLLPAPMLKMPYFPLTNIWAHWYGHITAAGFAGSDGIFLSFCLYFTTLLKSLAVDIKFTLRDAKDKDRLRNRTEKEVCYELMKIIERHNEIIELTAKFSKVMAALTLGHFVTSSIIIGSSVIDIMLVPGYGIVIYIVYTVAVLAEVFLYCFGGTAVIESSIDIADSAYCSEWYTYSNKIQKMVLLIIIRAQRALVVKVPFFAPSLPVLTSILRFTGSLIALANQIL